MAMFFDFPINRIEGSRVDLDHDVSRDDLGDYTRPDKEFAFETSEEECFLLTHISIERIEKIAEGIVYCVGERVLFICY